MALTPLGSGRFADDPDTRRGVNAMRHHNSVFHGVLKHLPWAEFDRLVAVHRADLRVRRLTTKSQLVALLYGQLAGAASLREIVTGLHSHAARLYHIGATLPRRATLADANSARPNAVFSELLALTIARAHRGLRRALAETTYLIDATGLRLDARSRGWARFCAGVCGVKLHVIYDPDADRPIFAAITPARVNDITAAQAMPIEPGATYVFDLGYYDYAWWAKLDRAQCRIVTRLKANTPLTWSRSCPRRPTARSSRTASAICRHAKAAAETILSRTRCARFASGSTPARSSASSPTTSTPRPSRSPISTSAAGRSSCSSAGSSRPSKSRRFLGTSENAVRIQIAVALIAFLLLRLAQTAQRAVTSPLAFARLVRTNLMHRKRLDRLLETEPPHPFNPAQLALQWNQS